MTHRERIEELVREGGSDLLIEIILKDTRLNDPLLMQIACIHKFKYEESQRAGKDIGWNETGLRWDHKGYARRFRELYSDEIRFIDIYSQIIKG